MENSIKQDYYRAAFDIGMQISRDAIWFEDQCNWLTASMEHESQHPKVYYKSMDSSFYGGTIGIAFFLNSLSRYTDEPLIKKTAIGAIKHALSAKDKVPEAARLGFFTGWTGLIFTLLQFEETDKNGQWHPYIKPLLDDILKIDYRHSGIDIIDGIAGAIPALIHICQKDKNQFLKPFIITIGDHLMSIAKKEKIGISWETMKGTKHNLTGYAHGSSGFIHAFIELYAFTNDKKYLDMAFEGQIYENSHFVKTQNNWPDFRDLEGFSINGQENTTHDVQCSCAWCHGAPGIGLARLRAYQITKNKSFLDDALLAIQTTKEQIILQPEAGFSLCHGLFGNAELLTMGYNILGDTSLNETVSDIGHFAIKESYKKDKPLTNGIGNGFLIPDFMTGTSGMGYQYLRFFDEGNLMSPLLICSS